MGSSLTPHYRSQVVCGVCGITQRTLDYWVATGVVAPAAFIETHKTQRRIHAYTFEDIVAVRTVKALRVAGLPLQAIRRALATLRSPRHRKASWLVTDGQKLYKPTDEPGVVESLAKGESGQLAFAVVALSHARVMVKTDIKRAGCKPFDPATYKGQLKPWTQRRIG